MRAARLAALLCLALCLAGCATSQPVSKGGATLYRARFSGFDEGNAQSVCKSLKRDGFSCFAMKGG